MHKASGTGSASVLSLSSVIAPAEGASAASAHSIASGDTILHWAQELQAIAQNGLAYTENPFDMERFQRVRDIATEMVALHCDLPIEKNATLFASEGGYQTPKLETRAAVFCADEILLVQENDGRWALPGGWVDAHISVKENTLKEVKEEAGVDVEALRIIAIQDRKVHNRPRYIYDICKVFVLCSPQGGCFVPNAETRDSAYFPLEQLPVLATEKSNREQIEMCFAAYHDPDWVVLFD